MQRKKGISLIVLVITIIVMIILAAAIILSLNNAGIIGNANKAVEETDEAQLKNIAALAWSDAYLARNEDRTKDLKAETIANIRKAGITAEKLPDSYIIVDEKGVLLLGIDKITHNSGIVEQGAKYIKADGTELTAGQNMPAPQALDRYVYDGYTYVYGATWNEIGYSKTTFEEQFKAVEGKEEWLVTVWENTEQNEYGEILSRINGKLVTDMSYTFFDNESIRIAPHIPETITNMEGAFEACTYMFALPQGFTIPSGVTNMKETFCLCLNLYNATITINANPEKYEYCFTDCQRVEIIGETTMKEELLATR